MDYILIIIIFAISFISYRTGLSDGQKLANNRDIKPINPIEAIKEHKIEKKAEIKQKEITNAIENLLSYDGSKQRG